MFSSCYIYFYITRLLHFLNINWYVVISIVSTEVDHGTHSYYYPTYMDNYVLGHL